ncbi:hypothetical protein GCM10023185_28470 [Hymenobacter saemangeumensis]|uniref:Response regulatory domain-containing protein n=1 Tax=Hymenobacter saemangeumensis TaxID=1084522 RepID=A0ABP8IL26_9BACT
MPKLPKVLLVDDDPTTLFLNTRLLQRLRVAEQVLVARNGSEALQTLQHLCPQPDEDAAPLLVLLDVHMPVMSGLAFLENYRQLPQARQCAAAIVVLTTSEHAHDLQRIQQLGVAADVLTKPLTRLQVESVLQRHFQPSSPPG